MKRATLTFCLLAFLAHPALAQSGPARGEQSKGTYLGILFSPVPDAVYSQVPILPRDAGVLITHVLPNSPAAKVKLTKNDIVLEYNNEKVQDPVQLAKLIRAGKKGETVTLKFLRAGKESDVKVTLEEGYELTLPEPTDKATPPGTNPRVGVGKPGGPPPVTVSAAPLENNGLSLTIEYYSNSTGRYQTHTCSGTPDEIDAQVKKLPVKLQEFARIAVKRARELELQKPEPPKSPSPSK